MKNWVLILLCLLGVVLSPVVAADQDASESASRTYELELSKTLTLDPKGQVPVIEKPIVANPPASPWSSLAWLGLVFGAAWLAYRQGKAFQFQATDRLRRKLTKSTQRATQLQIAMNEQTNGPRKQWQNTVETIERELQNKSSHIDQLKDSNSQLVVKLAESKKEIEQGVSDQQKLIRLHDDSISHLNQSNDKNVAQLKTDSKSALSKFKLESEQFIDSLKSQHQQAMNSLRQDSEQSHSEIEAEYAAALAKVELESKQALDQLTKQHEQTVADLNNTNDTLKAEHSQIISKLHGESKQLSTAHRQAIAQLQQEYEQTIAELKSESEQLTAKHDQAMIQLQQDSEHASKQREIEYHQANSKLQGELEQLTVNHSQAIADMEKDSTHVRQQLESQHEQRHDELENTYKKKISELETLLEEALDSNQELEKHQQELANNIQQLSDQRDTASKKIASLESSEHELNVQIDSGRTENQELLATLDAKRQEHQALEEKLMQSDEELTSLRDSIAQASDENQALNVLNAKLRNELNRSENTAQNLILKTEEIQSISKEQVNEWEHEKDVLITQLEKSSTKIDQLTQQVNNFDRSASDQSEELAQALEHISELEAQVKQRDADFTAIVDEIEPLREMSTSLDKLREENLAQREVISSNAGLGKEQEKTLITLQEIQAELKKEQDEANQVRLELGERDQEIANLENRLAELEDSEEALSRATKQHDEELEAAKVEIEELLEQNNKDREALSAKSIKLEKLQEKHDQKNKELGELDKLTRELDNTNKQAIELNEQKQVSEARIEKLQDQLHHKTELLYARDGRIQEMAEENTEKAHQLRRLKDQRTDFADTITNLEQQLSETEKAQLRDSSLEHSEVTTGKDIVVLGNKLEAANRERDKLAKNLLELEDRLVKANDQVDRKNMRVMQLGTQLVDYKTRQEQYLQNMARMEDQLLDLNHSNKQRQSDLSEHDVGAALRARDNIVNALEQQIVESDRTIEELKKQVENLQLSITVDDQEPKNGEQDEDQKIADLNKVLLHKSNEILRLKTDLKVHSDLVKVFEADSMQLQEIEYKLEETSETNQFLQNELTQAVNEVNLLKQQLSKANTIAERKKNIGRSTLPQPKQHQQLLYRLATLEAENRQQLELINSLQTTDRQIN